jgi:hypothetical protein
MSLREWFADEVTHHRALHRSINRRSPTGDPFAMLSCSGSQWFVR